MKRLTRSQDRIGGESAGVSSVLVEADCAKIEDLLQAYETALNASDVQAVLPLFTSDAVLMPQHRAPARGTDEVSAFYNWLFLAITFCVELRVDEIELIAPNWAFVRAHSDGYVIPLATGERVAGTNHGLFIFKKCDNEEWKIARYCFSTESMPRQ